MPVRTTVLGVGLREVVTTLWLFCEIGLSSGLSAPPSLTYDPFLASSFPFLRLSWQQKQEEMPHVLSQRDC